MKKLFALCFLSCFAWAANAQQEVIYHVFQRSFFDSNGDGHGDLKGMQQKLVYLKELGVTSIQLAPIYQSDVNGNDLATDFEKLDTAFGTIKEYKDLIREAHEMKLKVYQEVEMRYVGRHLWLVDSYQNPKSEYTDYILYKDKANMEPEFGYELTTYDGLKEKNFMVNLKYPKVRDYILQRLKYWADPNGDGRFADGVDGYKIAMEDNFGHEGKEVNLLQDFWAPVITDLKKLNPQLQIMANGANHSSFGQEFFTKAGADGVFADKLSQAIRSLDKSRISAAADSTFNHLPKDKYPIIYIENPDTDRFATGKDMGKLKIGAALNILMGGKPSIYYGQELGMEGQLLDGGNTDGNYIPAREAFEWHAADNGQGMALWYKDTGEWWDNRNMKANDGISLEEQRKAPNSLWTYYRGLIRLKKLHPALALGTYTEIPNDNDKVLSFTRTHDLEKVLVMVNLSDKPQIVTLGNIDVFTESKVTLPNVDHLKLLSGSPNAVFKRGGKMTTLNPYNIQVWQIVSK